MKLKDFYLLLCFAGLALPYSQLIPWLLEHRSLATFIPDMLANRISAFFVADVVVSAAVLLAFMNAECKKRDPAHMGAGSRAADRRRLACSASVPLLPRVRVGKRTPEQQHCPGVARKNI